MREAAEIIAAKEDWPPLYDLQALAKSPVRTASATYYEVLSLSSYIILQPFLLRLHRLR